MELRRSRRLQGLEPLEHHIPLDSQECIEDEEPVQTEEVIHLPYIAHQPIRYFNQCLGVVGSFVAALTLTRVVAAAVSLPGYTLF